MRELHQDFEKESNRTKVILHIEMIEIFNLHFLLFLNIVRFKFWFTVYMACSYFSSYVCLCNLLTTYKKFFHGKKLIV